MSQEQDQTPAIEAFGSVTDGRNPSRPVDRMAVLREIHMSLIRAEENIYTLLEASPGEASDLPDPVPAG